MLLLACSRFVVVLLLLQPAGRRLPAPVQGALVRTVAVTVALRTTLCH
tara:strand:- start:586 stop:729 length:144 start_codon:yes stop_codon:yes gene_type:complete